MTRRSIHRLTTLTVLGAAVLAFPVLSACSATSGSSSTVMAATPVDSELSENERADLLSMWAEEKLAHDVYLAFGTTHRMRIFSNIRQAEVRHRAAIRRLIDVYGLEVPREEPSAGVFHEPKFQALYDEMVREGRVSLADALAVGARIEEMDIADLRTARARATKPEIRDVYTQLERGSMNHLRAFLRQLDRQGVVFKPKHLTPREIEAIVSGHGVAS